MAPSVPILLFNNLQAKPPENTCQVPAELRCSGGEEWYNLFSSNRAAYDKLVSELLTASADARDLAPP